MFYIFTLNACFSDSLYHFSITLFDRCGTKICDIFGQRADLFGDKNLKIFDICIENISQNTTKSNGAISIRSDQATINPMETFATGKGFISISSDEFSANGSDWQFSGDSKKFTLNKNVQVFFKKTQTNDE
jgi:hypothetical protein